MSRTEVAAEIRALERLDLEGLRAVWADRYGPPAPRLRSRELLGLTLGWRIQAQAFGGLDMGVRRKLKDEKPPHKARVEVPIGTVLVREWKGVPQSVRRTPTGFEWRGRTYPSLTAAARAISGGVWSGPKFFGLEGGRRGQAQA
ncbi:MAG TPA: DUF2924 domain-containing protein [Brevundimonas sp.]|uniref:DUF2924 domain-containing protein n=1 Tax=Brevundimonas sp. TaxID=1871086 RepID=UPI002603177A|nr:DUF2924 domain-containing protein [Brevundimonas sp.]HRO33949.1 DUF2924 domain-containing protein [Brevundimonas sp.]